jgi:RNA polymerase sigma-70 factor (ECF subfamily)
VVSITDGGGITGAARIPVLGRERVAKCIATFSPRIWPELALTWIQVNGQPSVLMERGGSAYVLLAMEISPQGIRQIMWGMNPAKLSTISQSLQTSSQL